MKGTFQKLASVILIMAMVITSASLDSLQVSAATKKPTKITLNAKRKTLTVGKSFQLKVKAVKPTKASKVVTYKTENKKVAIVSAKGKIVAKKAGKTTITVTSKKNKKVKATCIVTVKKKVTTTKKVTPTKKVSAANKKPTKITLNAKSKTLTVGKSFQLKVKSVKPTKASKAVTYKSSNTKIATVSSKGKVSAKKAGKVSIKVTSKEASRVCATCQITVKSKSKPQKKKNISKVKNPVVSKHKVTYTCIYFGHYPQSDATGKKKDKIKWRVLSVKGNDAFLVADQNLDVMQYNKTFTDVTWETCTMRSWLNGYGSSANVCGIDYRNKNFIDKAFSKKEQGAIYTTNVVNKDNPKCGTEGGRNTRDKIFLLSFDEVGNSAYGFLPAWNAYNYIQDAARQRTNTHYVAAGGTLGIRYVNSAGDYDWWWLRSPGSNSYDAAGVGCDGNVRRSGNYVDYYNNAVCPALHLNLSSSSVWSMADSVTITR